MFTSGKKRRRINYGPRFELLAARPTLEQPAEERLSSAKLALNSYPATGFGSRDIGHC
jgi:hypothetical protein